MGAKLFSSSRYITLVLNKAVHCGAIFNESQSDLALKIFGLIRAVKTLRSYYVILTQCTEQQ